MKRGTMTRALSIACLLIGVLASEAAASHQLIFDVPPEGGMFEIPVHPARLTVLYFPAPVSSFVHGNTEGARIKRQQHILTVEVAPGSPAISMSVDCSLFRVGLLLRPVDDPKDVAVQVQFRDLSGRALIEAEVAKRMELRRAELDMENAKLDAQRAEIERTRQQLDHVIEERARMLIAAGMGKRLDIERVKATTRNRDHVIVRVREIVWLGEDAYIRLSIQNRGDRPYPIMDASLTADQIGYPAHLVRPGTGKELTQVPAEGVEQAILVIPKAAALGRETVELALSNGTRGQIKLRVFLQQ
jgi:hypothetical protein